MSRGGPTILSRAVTAVYVVLKLLLSRHSNRASTTPYSWHGSCIVGFINQALITRNLPFIRPLAPEDCKQGYRPADRLQRNSIMMASGFPSCRPSSRNRPLLSPWIRAGRGSRRVARTSTRQDTTAPGTTYEKTISAGHLQRSR